VLFRDEDGKAHVLDAFCSHLGAHLGHGGRVVGDCIECPFHAWKFNGKGECTEVPYANKIPPKANIAPWHVHEVNGLIMVWFHGQGEEPNWEVPALTEYQDDGWTPFETRTWTIRTHNQEMAENAVDAAHFLYLHGTQNMPETTAERHDHILHCQSTTKMKAYGTIVEGKIDVHCHGFGFTTTRFTGIVETLLLSSATAIDEDFVQIRFTFTVRKGPNDMVTSTVGEKFKAEIARQLEADIPVWENKKYIDPPLLCDGDGPVGIYRKWAKQFYTMPMPEHLKVG
jgi:phenylpropionate dioxygenase-like ring-hydroxylating dioxygenase large terminal subunit